MSENDDFKTNLINFVKILLDTISEQKLETEEQKVVFNKILDLYNDGFWDTEADINIQNDIYLFIMGFKCYKTFKDIL